MRAVALRNLGARKLRTFLTSLAVILGIMMVAGTYVLTDTIDQSFDKIFTESNQGIDAVVTSREEVETDDNSEPSFSDSVLDKVRATDGVAKAQGGIFDQQVAILDKDDEPIGGNGAPTFGGSDLDEPFDAFTYVKGGKPEADDQVVIDKQTADRGRIQDRRPDQGRRQGAGPQLRAGGHRQARQRRFLRRLEHRRVHAARGPADNPQGGRVRPDQRGRGRGGGARRSSGARSATRCRRSVEVETGEENTEPRRRTDVDEFINILRTALLIFAGVSLFVAAFLIFNTFSITVAQRTREFAMLRTLGASRRQLVTSVVLEAFVLGLFASVIGLVLGIGFAPAINALFQALEIDLPNEGTVIAARTIILSLVLGTLLTVLASLIPALRVTRVPPVTGLREGAVLETPKSHRVRTAVAFVLTGIGIALMLLGVFARAHPGEAWVGVGAVGIFIGVALLSPRLVRPMASLVGRPLERFRGVSRAPGARELGPQSRSHRLHGGGAHDRPGAWSRSWRSSRRACAARSTPPSTRRSRAS